VKGSSLEQGEGDTTELNVQDQINGNPSAQEAGIKNKARKVAGRY
jgi:hypothetical protein